MKRCVILANGEIGDIAGHRELIGESDIVLCADGGANHALRLGIVPRGIAGDLDSVSPAVLEHFAAQGTEIRRVSPIKDELDSQLVMEWAFDFEPEEIIFLGGIGHRLDHTIGGIHLLLRAAERGITCRLINEVQEIFLITPAMPACKTVENGTVISLLPLGDEAGGIKFKNLKYQLKSGKLQVGFPVGISNVATGSPVEISLTSGVLVAFLNYSGNFGKPAIDKG